jgi:hypothetical protein
MDDLTRRVLTRHLEASFDKEAALRDVVRLMAQPWKVIQKDFWKTMKRPLDDIVDDAFRKVAPDLVRAILEEEVAEDVSEAEDGFNHGRADGRSGLNHGARVPRGVSTDWMEGYDYGFENFTDTSFPAHLKKEVIEDAIREVRHEVTEDVVERAAKKVWSSVNPAKTVRMIIQQVKKHGWKLGIVFGLVEVLETIVIPGILISITNNPAWAMAGQLPLSEVLYAVVFSYLGRTPKELDKPSDRGHLEWYEMQYGPVMASTTAQRVASRYQEKISTMLGFVLSEAAQEQFQNQDVFPDLFSFVAAMPPGVRMVHFQQIEFEIPGQ